MNPLHTGLVLLACAALVTVVGFLARVKLDQIGKRDRAVRSFYRQATELVADSRVPNEVVSLLGFLSGKLGSKSALVMFAVLALATRGTKEEPESDLHNVVVLLPPRVQQSLFTAINAFFASLCWHSLFLSWFFRWATRPVRKRNGDHHATELLLIEKGHARAA
jgi:hypothetical protein